MSVGGVKPVTADEEAAALHWIRANMVRYLALFGRTRRNASSPAWRGWLGFGIGAAAVIVVAAMIVVDAWAIGIAHRLPEPVVAAFDWITDYGKSVRVLVPIGLMLAAIALLASPRLTRMSRSVLAAVAVRLGYLFVAIALPGLFVTIVKRLIGRARPLIETGADPFLYRPFGWHVEYASLPSGHATDAFAIATAIGALWPSTRPLLWTYAVLIAVSRVVLTAHFPSDVIAGAFVGIFGAVLVRHWFAARRLAFVRAPDGSVRALAGPSTRRIKSLATSLAAH
jgi:membrane-associated phospholipid phosphatase